MGGLLGESQSWRNDTAREVRRKTFQLAQTRVRRALNRELPREDRNAAAELAAALDRVGL